MKCDIAVVGSGLAALVATRTLFNLDRQLMLEKSTAPAGHFPPPSSLPPPLAGESRGGGDKPDPVGVRR